MPLLVEAVVEFNDDGCLIFAANYVGAFARGRTQDEALAKFDREIARYLLWSTGEAIPRTERVEVRVVQAFRSDLQICDADSEVIFERERLPLDRDAYERQRVLAMKSAHDFQTLYDAIPDKQRTSLAPRNTFYGAIPRTAEEMYAHTNRVTGYYFGEIGVRIEHRPDLAANRAQAFRRLESDPDFLTKPVSTGSYGEQWSLRKVLRRFVWHDRIHAKAMYRMAAGIWGDRKLCDPFHFAG